MQQIIDRRLSGGNKSIGNRERFLRRHKDVIRDAVRRAVDSRSIRDMERGEDIRVPKRDIVEPVFGHAPGGSREIVHPGNQDFVRGDRIARPKGGGGSGGGRRAGNSGEGEDDFVFHLTKEEFMQVFFDDLALPNLNRTELADVPEYKSHRAGLTTDGSQNNLHVLRSMRGAIGRRIALGAASRRELEELEAELDALRRTAATAALCVASGRAGGDCDRDGDGDAIDTSPASAADAERLTREVARLEGALRSARERIARIPYLDPIDLRFRNRVRVPVPTSKAVMFCLMDVSGSMDEGRKDLSKRFFILLYLFLTRHYEKIDIVFIRHHTQAQEVDEHTFFHSVETGGTVVSSALELMNEIARARYPSAEWNIYGAQASDGDNWHQDSGLCRTLLAEKILPLCRYYAYVQVAEPEQNLWTEYAELVGESKAFAMRKVTELDHIYPVFRDLFKKEGAAA